MNFSEGTPITKDLAVELRQLVFGSSAAPPRGEWTRTGIVFGSPNQDLAYGLLCQRNGTRGLLSVLQGFILKYFLFDKRYRERVRSVEEALRPNENHQVEALIQSMVEILLAIAGKTKVVIALPGEEPFIPHSLTYFQDSVTEKLYLFEMKRMDQVQVFLRRNLKFFTEDPGPGAMLFLYSAVLTRTLVKVRTDLDCLRGTYLVGPTEEGSLNVVTLLLTGRATPYLHNGVIHVGDEEHYAIPQYGVLNRTFIGLLLLEITKGNVVEISKGNSTKFMGFLTYLRKNEFGISTEITRQPGSRLKTPILPIWITCCAGHYGVIFNSNQDLLRNYHAESKFDLMYYSCSGNQISMTVDNKHYNERATYMLQRQSSVANAPLAPEREESVVVTPLERLIRTKWEEAFIRVHSQPSLLSYLFNTAN